MRGEKKKIENVIGTDQTRKHNLVTVMFVIVTIFLVCNLSEPFFSLYVVVFPNPKRPDTCFFMITINASVNAVVYGIFSRNYRKTLFKMVCRITKPKRSLEDPPKNLEISIKDLKTQKSL